MPKQSRKADSVFDWQTHIGVCPVVRLTNADCIDVPNNRRVECFLIEVDYFTRRRPHFNE